MAQQPDWQRLHQALLVEAQHGFGNLQGKQYYFSEFLCLSFGGAPPVEEAQMRHRWQEMAARFAVYPKMSLAQRKQLVADAKHFLYELQDTIEQPKTIPTRTKPLYQNHPTYLRLDQPIAYLPKIGSTKSKQLEKLGLHCIRDLLFYYPRDYLDYAHQVKIAALEPGETVTVVGTVKRCSCFSSPKNKKLTIFELIIRDNTGQLRLTRFFAGQRFNNRGWQESLKRQYPQGAVVAASGLVKQNKYSISLDNPEIEVIDSPGAAIESVKIGRVLPIYRLSTGVNADVVRNAIIAALPVAGQIKDPLPYTLRNQYGLIDLQEAIANIHFPEDQKTLAAARRRLVFDEFFYLQLGFLQRRQQQRQGQPSAIFTPVGRLVEEFASLLPFTLTGAQQRVINEILEDLNSSEPMNRLIQGDVGSGKTVVGVFAILAAIQSGYQAALMAPTEVLAQQHYRKIVEWFNLLHLPVELLTGSTKTNRRREIHAQLQTGELPLLVGTHALIQDPVNFHRLGLVVIDEQHRFGVEQRAQLLAKGEAPHVLTMTATPIPRTLALTLHGDLDVSQIDELPPGRQTIETQVVVGKQRTQVYDLVRREIAQGRQVYIILPLVEESEKLDLRAAVEEHQRLSEKVFPEFSIGLLHGRINSQEKDEVLIAFRDNQHQILVSTTVVEVGVDVPNATLMLVEHAERFGLAQLHQLRGRIGRGSHKSYCFLMSSTRSQDAQQRLRVLEQSQDGFFIAEMDMRFRGPGEVLGKRQSGLPDFALASLEEDQDVLNIAREAAEKIMLAEKSLGHFPSLKQELEIRYRKLIGRDMMN